MCSGTKATAHSSAIAGGQASNFAYNQQESIYDCVLESNAQAEDIYGSLVSYQKKETPQQGSGFAGLPEKLGFVVAELLETEKSYVEVLNVLTEHYIGPLKSRLDADVRKIVFINLPVSHFESHHQVEHKPWNQCFAVCVCACVHACVCARAPRARACVCVCVCVCV